jgi:predicted NUDIX family NTP pyrophosphohydrolase
VLIKWEANGFPYSSDMKKTSRIAAGLLLFRRRNQGLEVLLVHPGGPFFKKKDEGHWSIPKGVVEEGEALFDRARIEFEEEVGLPVEPAGDFIDIGQIVQKGGKIVHAWACEGDLPADYVCRSNTFEMEWPPSSGKMQTFPEVDCAEFLAIDRARKKIKPTQEPFLDRLVKALQK